MAAAMNELNAFSEFFGECWSQLKECLHSVTPSAVNKAVMEYKYALHTVKSMIRSVK